MSEIHYCPLCFQWVYSASDWDVHCEAHIQNLESKGCGTITHAYTLVRPGSCPFCLGNDTLPASRRLESWTRDHKLWSHVNNHLEGQPWPLACPHPLCDILIPNDTELLYHFVDDHGFSRTRPAPKSQAPQFSARGLKRKAPDQDDFLHWMPPPQLPTGPTTVSPTLLHNARVCSTLPVTSPRATPSDASTMWSPRSSEPQSCTSSLPLTDDGSFDDGLFTHFLRSPSLTPPPLPEENSLGVVLSDSQRISTLDIPTPISLSSQSAPSQQSCVHEDTAPWEPRPRVVLRIKPPRPESKPKLVLRLTQPKPRRGTKRRRK